jgi:hypothetical protein
MASRHSRECTRSLALLTGMQPQYPAQQPHGHSSHPRQDRVTCIRRCNSLPRRPGSLNLRSYALPALYARGHMHSSRPRQDRATCHPSKGDSLPTAGSLNPSPPLRSHALLALYARRHGAETEAGNDAEEGESAWRRIVEVPGPNTKQHTITSACLHQRSQQRRGTCRE